MNYDLFIGLHILAVIAWMAGLLYLPRLFAYHTRATPGSEMDETFKIMEAKLYRMIMTPASIVVFILGCCLIWIDAHIRGDGLRFLASPWMSTKLAGVLLMFGYHGFLGKARRDFAANRNKRSERFWRLSNEIPFLLAIVMVLAVTTKFGGG
ncbi:MAG: CopD family protein [Caulobacteraceae bacterium]